MPAPVRLPARGRFPIRATLPPLQGLPGRRPWSWACVWLQGSSVPSSGRWTFGQLSSHSALTFCPSPGDLGVAGDAGALSELEEGLPVGPALWAPRFLLECGQCPQQSTLSWVVPSQHSEKPLRRRDGVSVSLAVPPRAPLRFEPYLMVLDSNLFFVPVQTTELRLTPKLTGRG